jgi:hypothetical protein
MNRDLVAPSNFGSPAFLPAGFPVQPFAADLVFPDVDAEVLAREEALPPGSAWNSFMVRTLPRHGVPRLRRVR